MFKATDKSSTPDAKSEARRNELANATIAFGLAMCLFAGLATMNVCWGMVALFATFIFGICADHIGAEMARIATALEKK